MARTIWEIERKIEGEWAPPVFFSTKKAALAHLTGWLRQGFTVSGPRKRTVHTRA